jgi:hypothetical protein
MHVVIDADLSRIGNSDADKRKLEAKGSDRLASREMNLEKSSLRSS